MAVTGINNSDSYTKLSTLKEINKASDNAAGLAISEKLKGQINGYEKGVSNGQSGQDMLKTADGGLSSINDSLQRIRELGIQASNGTNSQEDKQAIQDEVDQLKNSIQDAAKGTEYNTKKLLDGSMADTNLALNPDGTGMKIQMDNSTLESLGIADFDVTEDFDLSTIDKAIEKVGESRSKIGSVQNALSHSISNNMSAGENLEAANARITDADIAKAVSDDQKEKVIEEYNRFAMMQQVKNSGIDVNKMLGL